MKFEHIPLYKAIINFYIEHWLAFIFILLISMGFSWIFNLFLKSYYEED